MKSNIGTKMTFKTIIIILVICITIGILSSMSEKKLIAKSNTVTLATSKEIETTQIARRNLTHSSTGNTISSRSSTSSRLKAEANKQKTVEEEKLRLEAEEKAKQEAETKKLAQIENIKSISISVNMDLTQRIGLSKEEFKMLIGNLKADTTKFFYDNSDYIYDLCEKYELNEIFFCGLISAESGWNIAQNHRRTHNYISLMSNGKLIKYNSLEEGLEIAAQKLHDNYLSENGKFYYGKTLSAVKTKFCPSDTWVGLVYGRMNQIVQAKNIEI